MMEAIEHQKTFIDEAVSGVIDNIQAPNIVVIGRTGVGKSSLINAVFGIDIAEVGAGLPVTKGFHVYRNEIITIYDSAGYETGYEKNFREGIFSFLETKQKGEIAEQIHLVWYIMNAASGRVEYFELDIIKALGEHHIPTVIVLSQCDRAKEAEIQEIKSLLSREQVTQDLIVIETSAHPLIIRGRPICEPFGLTELIDITIKLLPNIYADAVRIAQVVDVKAKRELAWKVIAGATLAVFGSSFVPLSGSTSITSVVIQSSLSLSIASIYGFSDLTNFLPRAYESIVRKGGMKSLGALAISLAFDVLKPLSFPIGVLAGTTAASLTVIIGLAYTSAFEATAKAPINQKNPEEVQSFFVSELEKAFSSYSHITIKTPQDLESLKDWFINK
jgi:predicted GTPase